MFAKIKQSSETHHLKENLTSNSLKYKMYNSILIDFLHTVKAATLIFISRRGSAISSAKQGKSGSIYKLVNN